MSTYAEIIGRVDSYKPSAFETEEKLRWLTELDGKIAVEVMMLNPEFVRNMPRGEVALSCEPLIGFPYEDLYDRWLEAKIDYHNGEFSAYQNAMEAYNAAYNGWLNWFLNSYDPVQGYERMDEYGT